MSSTPPALIVCSANRILHLYVLMSTLRNGGLALRCYIGVRGLYVSSITFTDFSAFSVSISLCLEANALYLDHYCQVII